METELSSNMTCWEKIKKYQLYYFLKFCLYSIILIVFYFLEKLIFIIINIIFHFWFISIIVQIIFHLWILRYLVLKVEFAGLSFILFRSIQYKIGTREALFILNELETLNSALNFIFDEQNQVEELKHLTTIQRNVKSASSIIKAFQIIFSKMKVKFDNLTFEQNIFLQNLTNLYNSFEESNFLNLINEIIKQLRQNKICFIKDLTSSEKEKIINEKKKTKKYVESMKISLKVLINLIRDYIGYDYLVCSPRYIRNFFKNYLFASIQQFDVELDNYYIYQKKKLNTKDGNILDYIIIKNNNRKEKNNNEKKLIIICGPNAEPYQIFSRNIVINKYLSKGIDILCWNYRGYGFSTGKATFDNLKSDIIEIYDEIKKWKIYQNIGVHGISIGGVPSCYLAYKKKDICLLVSDRNFGQIEYIVRNCSVGKYLEILYKLLFIPSSRNVEYYFESHALKIILNDPNDDIVTEEGSLKTLLSEEFCNKFLELNQNDSLISFSDDDSRLSNIEMETLDESKSNILSKTNKKKNNSKDNLLNDLIISSSIKNDIKKYKKKATALDIILLGNKKLFINSLINISEAINNKKLIYKKQSFFTKVINLFNNYKIENNEYLHLKQEEFQNSDALLYFVINKISSIFEKFKSAGDNLLKLTKKNSEYNKILFIENFFNNLFIWGTYDTRDDYGSVYHSTEYINIMLSKVIEMIELFLNSQEIANYKQLDIIKDIETFYDCLNIIKENLKFLGIKNKNDLILLSDGNNYEKELIKLGRGNLVWINCGHNGLISSEENLVFKHYLKESYLFKEPKNKAINNKNEDNNDNDSEDIIYNNNNIDDDLENTTSNFV